MATSKHSPVGRANNDREHVMKVYSAGTTQENWSQLSTSLIAINGFTQTGMFSFIPDCIFVAADVGPYMPTK